MEKVVTPTALIIIDGDVVKNYLNPDVEYTREDSASNFKAFKHLITHSKVFHLVVPDSSTQVTMRVNEVGDEQFEAIKRAEAIIIKTLAHRILSKAFKQVRGLKYPVRVFECEKDALAWFDELREKNGCAS